jgi:hypothetical protein
MELKAAAERLRRGFNHAHCPDHCGDCNDARTLADAYLAEHPADDDEPISEEWSDKIAARCWTDGTDQEWKLGIGDTGHEAFLLLAKRENGIFWAMYMGGVKLQMIVTRADVRRLCSALGIALREDKE